MKVKILSFFLMLLGGGYLLYSYHSSPYSSFFNLLSVGEMYRIHGGWESGKECQRFDPCSGIYSECADSPCYNLEEEWKSYRIYDTGCISCFYQTPDSLLKECVMLSDPAYKQECAEKRYFWGLNCIGDEIKREPVKIDGCQSRYVK